MLTRICIVCGKEFEATRRDRIYCSERCRCRSAKRREYERIRYARARAQSAPKPERSIDDVVRAAAFSGQSYGQFVAGLKDRGEA